MHDPNLCAPEPRRPKRSIVLGDLQAPLRQILDVLDGDKLVSSDGWIAPDVKLICVGDYFDFRTADPVSGGRDGLLLLSWLAAHHPRQVTLLIGNHDIERVCSLASATMNGAREARQAALHLEGLIGRCSRREFLEEWIDSHPGHQVPLIAARDYSCFDPEQGQLIRRLLLGGRLQVATVATIYQMSQPALVTHAGVTRGTLATRGWAADPHALATSLNELLQKSVDAVRSDWSTGKTTPLSFALHSSWTPLRPCSGMLVHRPRSRPEFDRHHFHLGLDEPVFPRSLSIEEFLIPGLVQIVGHTRTKHVVDMVGAWHGRFPPDPVPLEPLTLDLIHGHGEYLGPLDEVIECQVTSRFVFTDIGFARPSDDVIYLLEVDYL